MCRAWRCSRGLANSIVTSPWYGPAGLQVYLCGTQSLIMWLLWCCVSGHGGHVRCSLPRHDQGSALWLHWSPSPPENSRVGCAARSPSFGTWLVPSTIVTTEINVAPSCFCRCAPQRGSWVAMPRRAQPPARSTAWSARAPLRIAVYLVWCLWVLLPGELLPRYGVHVPSCTWASRCSRAVLPHSGRALTFKDGVKLLVIFIKQRHGSECCFASVCSRVPPPHTHTTTFPWTDA